MNKETLSNIIQDINNDNKNSLKKRSKKNKNNLKGINSDDKNPDKKGKNRIFLT